jgi:HEAT repeat protein
MNRPEARIAMRQCLQDSDARVVGNAVFGLHLLKEGDILRLVERMMVDERPPFRATAAWLVGEIGNAEYSGLLERARNDSEANVRLAAKQAMVKLQQSAEIAEARLQPAEQSPKTSPDPPKPSEKTAAIEPKKKTTRRQLLIQLDGKAAKTRWD